LLAATEVTRTQLCQLVQVQEDLCVGAGGMCGRRKLVTNPTLRGPGKPANTRTIVTTVPEQTRAYARTARNEVEG
jgi:hypothetical protein